MVIVGNYTIHVSYIETRKMVLQIPIFVPPLCGGQQEYLSKRIGLFFQKTPGSHWVVTRRPGRLQCSHRLGLIWGRFHVLYLMHLPPTNI